MEFKAREPSSIVTDLEEKTRLVSLIREAAPPHDDFESGYRKPMEAFADWAQNLPACTEHHADPGGLARFAVQAGYYAMRLADGVVFGPDLGAEERRIVERQSRHAAFLAALVSAVALPHQYLDVRLADGEVWSEFSAPCGLGPWVRERGGQYVVAWRERAGEVARNVCAWLAGNLLMSYLVNMRRDVALAAMAAVCPSGPPQGAIAPMERIVRQALISSVDVEKQATQARYIPPAEVVLPGPEQLTSHGEEGASDALDAARKNTGQEQLQPPAASHTPSERSQASPPSQSELQLGDASSRQTVESLPAALKQLVEALAEDVRAKEALRKRVAWDDSGYLVVDQNLLGAYGMGPPAAVANALKKAHVAQDGNGRALRLVESVGELILPREKAA